MEKDVDSIFTLQDALQRHEIHDKLGVDFSALNLTAKNRHRAYRFAIRALPVFGAIDTRWRGMFL